MKMTIMQGLPASGKSTHAQEIVRQSGNSVRINKDLLRTMLHFDKFTGPNEEKTRGSARILARYFLSECNVIIDDTNLNPGTLQSWKDLAKELKVQVEVIRMETPIEECIARDEMRENSVGRSVILGMAMKAGLYEQSKDIVICDIDGTLADCEHRQHFVRQEKKDWKSFFDAMPFDTPRKEIVQRLSDLERDHEIFLVSGRPESHRLQTESWLGEYAFQDMGEGRARPLPYKALFMRSSHDKRADDIVKQEIYDAYFKKYRVHLVIDDRPSVIRMWRSNGLQVEDVGTGEEF